MSAGGSKNLMGGESSLMVDGNLPVTVSAVANRLGVSPSTLRTWDRRYGLGPSEHRAGSHRRYSAQDVYRLERVAQMVKGGVNIADAARAVVEASPALVPNAYGSTGIDELMEAAIAGDQLQAQFLVEKSVAEYGVVKSWVDLVSPAIEKLRNRVTGDRPGIDPFSILQNQMLRAVSLQQAETASPSLYGPQVLFCVGRTQRTQAHVLGSELAQNGVQARILTVRSQQPVRMFRQYCRENFPEILCVFAEFKHSELLVQEALAARIPETVIIDETGTTQILHQRVTRVRTLTAASNEIIALATARR